MGMVTFSELELSAIGEIMNISLGASATAISNMLDTKVDITTPKVAILPTSQFDFSIIDPAVCAEISYRVGLDGKNGLLLKMDDVRVIVEMLMHAEIPAEDFELSELYMSAICEVMNQMMGSSATALSEFLDKTVDISTPQAYVIDDQEEFKKTYFGEDDQIVSVSFTLKIGDKLESEFINIMRIPLVKELVKAFIPTDENEDLSGKDKSTETPPVSTPETADKEEPKGSGPLSQAEIESLLNNDMSSGDSDKANAKAENDTAQVSQTQPEIQEEIPVAVQMSMPAQEISNQQEMPIPPAADMQQMMAQMQQMQKMMAQMQQGGMTNNASMGGRMVNTHPIPTKASGQMVKGEEQMENKELVMGVPLELSVEIGRTRKTVREILELTKGSLVVLDKLAGEQVDLFVNGRCIAKGDVVVVEDNFGIRVTEIVNKNDVTL